MTKRLDPLIAALLRRPEQGEAPGKTVEEMSRESGRCQTVVRRELKALWLKGEVEVIHQKRLGLGGVMRSHAFYRLK